MIHRLLLALLGCLLALAAPVSAHTPISGRMFGPPPVTLFGVEFSIEQDCGPLTLHLDGLHDRAGPCRGVLVRQNPWSAFDPEGLETKKQLEDQRDALDQGFKRTVDEINKMEGPSKEEKNKSISDLTERMDERRKGINDRIEKIERSARDLAKFAGGEPDDYYEELDDSKANVKELINLRDTIDGLGAGNSFSNVVDGNLVGMAKSLVVDQALGRVKMLAKVKDKLRKKPVSLGKFKGTDALRAENKMAGDAAKKAGLSKDQAKQLHKEISGQGYGFDDILIIAKQIKSGQ